MKNKHKLLSVSAGLASVALLASLNAGEVKAASTDSGAENQLTVEQQQKENKEYYSAVNEAKELIAEAKGNDVDTSKLEGALTEVLTAKQNARQYSTSFGTFQRLLKEKADVKKAFDEKVSEGVKALEAGSEEQHQEFEVREGLEDLEEGSKKQREGFDELKAKDLLGQEGVEDWTTAATSEAENGSVKNAFDGRPDTAWVSNDGDKRPNIAVAFDQPRDIQSVVYRSATADKGQKPASASVYLKGNGEDGKPFEKTVSNLSLEGQSSAPQVLSVGQFKGVKAISLTFPAAKDGGHVAVAEIGFSDEDSDTLNKKIEQEERDKKFSYDVTLPSDEELSATAKRNADEHEAHALGIHDAEVEHKQIEEENKATDERNKALDELNDILDQEEFDRKKADADKRADKDAEIAKKYFERKAEESVVQDAAKEHEEVEEYNKFIDALGKAAQHNAEEHDLHEANRLASEAGKINAEEHDLHEANRLASEAGKVNAEEHDLHAKNAVDAALKAIEDKADAERKEFEQLDKAGYIETKLPSNRVLSKASKHNAEEHDLHGENAAFEQALKDAENDHNERVLAEVSKQNAEEHDLHHKNAAKFADTLKAVSEAAQHNAEEHDLHHVLDNLANGSKKQHEGFDFLNNGGSFETGLPSKEVLSEVAKQNAEEHDLHKAAAEHAEIEAHNKYLDALDEAVKHNAEEHDLHAEHAKEAEFNEAVKKAAEEHNEIVEHNKFLDALDEAAKHNAEEHDFHAENAKEAAFEEAVEKAEAEHKEIVEHNKFLDALDEAAKQNAEEHDLHHANAELGNIIAGQDKQQADFEKLANGESLLTPEEAQEIEDQAKENEAPKPEAEAKTFETENHAAHAAHQGYDVEKALNRIQQIKINYENGVKQRLEQLIKRGAALDVDTKALSDAKAAFEGALDAFKPYIK